MLTTAKGEFGLAFTFFALYFQNLIKTMLKGLFLLLGMKTNSAKKRIIFCKTFQPLKRCCLKRFTRDKPPDP